jgi:hypothetical protein
VARFLSDIEILQKEIIRNSNMKKGNKKLSPKKSKYDEQDDFLCSEDEYDNYTVTYKLPKVITAGEDY